MATSKTTACFYKVENEVITNIMIKCVAYSFGNFTGRIFNDLDRTVLDARINVEIEFKVMLSRINLLNNKNDVAVIKTDLQSNNIKQMINKLKSYKEKAHPNIYINFDSGYCEIKPTSQEWSSLNWVFISGGISNIADYSLAELISILKTIYSIVVVKEKYLNNHYTSKDSIVNKTPVLASNLTKINPLEYKVNYNALPDSFLSFVNDDKMTYLLYTDLCHLQYKLQFKNLTEDYILSFCNYDYLFDNNIRYHDLNLNDHLLELGLPPVKNIGELSTKELIKLYRLNIYEVNFKVLTDRIVNKIIKNLSSKNIIKIHCS